MKIIVGINGKTDSFAAASILCEQGHEVTGAVIAPEGADISSAAAAAEKVQVPFVCVRGEETGAAEIVSALCAYARENGFDAVATGYYCEAGKIENDNDDDKKTTYFIKRSANADTDQSYMLCMLSRDDAGMLVFPLCGMTHGEVDKYASDRGFVLTERSSVCTEERGTAANSIRIKKLVFQAAYGPDHAKGYSTYLCRSLVKLGTCAELFESHVYTHQVVGSEDAADIIFFESGRKVEIGMPAAVYDADGNILLGGRVCEILD